MTILPAFATKAAVFLLLALTLLAVGVTGQVTPPQGLTSVALGGQLSDATLEYVVTLADPRADGQDTVTMVYTVPQESWLAIGFSSDGKMIGSGAVIGLPDSGEVLKYSLSAFDVTGVVPMPEAQQTLIETSLVQENGTTKMQFTKIMDEAGEQPIVIGSNIFLGAIGLFNELFYHSKRDAFGINLVAVDTTTTTDTDTDTDSGTMDSGETDSGQAEKVDTGAATATAIVIETRNRTLWKAHGWCAALAWGLFSPLAIAAALLRNWLPDGAWFTIHYFLNLGVGALTIAAFCLAVAAINSEAPSGGVAVHFLTSPYPHRFVGLVVFLMVLFQVVSGQFRPHTPERGEEKSTRSWEVLHRVMGVSLLALGWYQIQSGIKIYQTFFADSADANLSAIFWGIVGTISGIVVVGLVLAKISKGGDDDDEEAVKEDDDKRGDSGEREDVDF
eukprot:jgi/Psemu1/289867/fgenesh1_pg.412_\